MDMDKERVFLQAISRGEFEIDSDGRIWRTAKRTGRGWHGPGTVLRPCLRVRGEYRTQQGYLCVTITVVGHRTATGAHRIVWSRLNGRIPKGLTINHKNGVKDDNRPQNLELATYSEQRRHALDVLNVNRNHPTGSKHPKTHLMESDVIEMRLMREGGVMVKTIAEKYSMNPKAVSAICHRRTWTHI